MLVRPAIVQSHAPGSHHPCRVKISSNVPFLDPGDGLDSAVGYGFDEGVVVALVLVRVAGGEVSDGVIDGAGRRDWRR